MKTLALLFLLTSVAGAHDFVLPAGTRVDAAALKAEMVAGGVDARQVHSVSSKTWIELGPDLRKSPMAKILSVLTAHDPDARARQNAAEQEIVFAAYDRLKSGGLSLVDFKVVFLAAFERVFARDLARRPVP